MSTILETDRLILRNYKESDIDDYFEYMQNKKVCSMAGMIPCYTKEKAINLLKMDSMEKFQFAIVLKEINKVIGSIGIMKYLNSNRDDIKEIAFLLSEKYWGQGIMTEALKEITRYTFEDLNASEVHIRCAEANIGSQRTQEKCGFEIAHNLHNSSIFIDGVLSNIIERVMTKEEYFEKSKNKRK